MSLLPRVGLCSVCRHVKVAGNRRGSLFYLCQRSAEDPAFPRYPGLPVLACRGFEPQSPGGETQPEQERP